MYHYVVVTFIFVLFTLTTVTDSQSCFSINERLPEIRCNVERCLELFQCATLNLKVICCGYEFETFAACVPYK